jgi:ribulose-phosphate 3-epimerase
VRKIRPLIAPSILSADFTKLGEELERVKEADLIHFDVMDGHFVPNISYGLPVAEAVKRVTDIPLDVHLMVEQPERFLHSFAELKPAYITVHYEAVTHLQRTLAQIRELGVGAGLALNPHTPLTGLKYILSDLDLILIMTVNPGYGGQRFIPAMLDKIRDCRALTNGYPIKIQVDGGVSTANARQLVDAGVDILVAGSAIFSSPDPGAYMRQMRAEGD